MIIITAMQQDIIKLEDLIPAQADLRLWVNGKLKNFKLRPIDLRDEVWMANKFGAGIQEIFEQVKMEEICHIIFHQLENKEPFKAIEYEEYDDDGEVLVLKKTGPHRVMEGIKGVDHKVEVFKALLETIGISKPMLNELEQKEVVKKKVISKKAKKKR